MKKASPTAAPLAFVVKLIWIALLGGSDSAIHFCTSRKSAGYRLGPQDGTVKERFQRILYIYISI